MLPVLRRNGAGVIQAITRFYLEQEQGDWFLQRLSQSFRNLIATIYTEPPGKGVHIPGSTAPFPFDPGKVSNDLSLSISDIPLPEMNVYGRGQILRALNIWRMQRQGLDVQHLYAAEKEAGNPFIDIDFEKKAVKIVRESDQYDGTIFAYMIENMADLTDKKPVKSPSPKMP